MLRPAVGIEDTLSRRWGFCQLAGRAPWTCQQLSAAVRAYALQDVRSAISAESAFERADEGISRIGRQISVATFATGA
jgi:hypothetical protein